MALRNTNPMEVTLTSTGDEQIGSLTEVRQAVAAPVPPPAPRPVELATFRPTTSSTFRTPFDMTGFRSTSTAELSAFRGSQEMTTYEIHFKTSKASRDAKRAGNRAKPIAIRLNYSDGSSSATMQLSNRLLKEKRNKNFKKGQLDRFLFQARVVQSVSDIRSITLACNESVEFNHDLIFSDINMMSVKYRHHWRFTMTEEGPLSSRPHPSSEITLTPTQTWAGTNRPHLVGPLLNLKNVSEAHWQVSVLIVFDASAPSMTTSNLAVPTQSIAVGTVGAVGGLPSQFMAPAARSNLQPGPLVYTVDGQDHFVEPQRLAAPYNDVIVCKWELVIHRGPADQIVGYRIANIHDTFYFTVPGMGAIPKFAYTSCSGFEATSRLPDELLESKQRNRMFLRLWEQHTRENYHVMLNGGDQVYCDTVWSAIKELGDFVNRERFDEARGALSFTPQMLENCRRFYFDMYCWTWSQPELRRLLASVPAVNMWDDHDIFDGFGSYPDAEMAGEVYQGIFRAAKEMFVLFQLHQNTDSLVVPREVLMRKPYMSYGSISTSVRHDNFTQGFVMGPVAVLAMDLRSERSYAQVMMPETRQMLYAWMENLPPAVRFVLVMSSVPVIYFDLNMMEKRVGRKHGVPEGLADDLRDQWGSAAHSMERQELIANCMRISQMKDMRVIFVSGDVHVASRGVIVPEGEVFDRNTCIIPQWTSSAMVSSPPPALALRFLPRLFKHKYMIGENVRAELLKFDLKSAHIELPFFSKSRRFVDGRHNFMSIVDTGNQDLMARWHFDDVDHVIEASKMAAKPGPFNASRFELDYTHKPSPCKVM